MDGTTPKIADFGLARSTRLAPVTQSVDIKGTMPYMSPEHFLDFKKADQGADIYSLGKILYEALVGKIPPETIPFKSASLEKAETPFLQKLDRIIQAATAEEREERIESVAELRKTLLEALDIIGVQTATEAAETPRTHSFLYQAKWIWAGIAVAVIAVMAMTVWHFLGEPGKQQMPSEQVQVTRGEPSQADQAIMGNDGLTMLLVHGGDMRSDQGNTLQLQSYYIDKTKVSNHHFAEFLNEVKDSVLVENGVVKKAEEIWFYLGEGTESYEQIIYRHNRFHLRDPKYAALPVVRVTWYGASAYARHYRKRLLKEHEWQYAARKGIIQSRVSLDGTASTRSDVVKKQVSKPSEQMMGLHHRIEEDSSSASEQSLKGKAPKEWVVRAENQQGITDDKQQASYPSLIIGGSSVSRSEMKSVRYPWEGFFDVGFRCALSIERGDQ
jgi:serine/threonine-protein kinase